MKKLKQIYSMFIMFLLTFFLFVFSGCSDSVNGVIPTEWHFGTMSPTDAEFVINATNGDFYLDTDDGDLYQLIGNKWEKQGNINSHNDVNVEDLDGKNGEDVDDVAFSYSIDENGMVYVEVKTEFTGEKELVLVTTPMPLVVNEIRFGEFNLYYIKDKTDNMKCLATYANGQEKEISITDDMIIVDETYMKPDFTTEGSYPVKVNYYGRIATAIIEVIDEKNDVVRNIEAEEEFLLVNVDEENNINSCFFTSNLILDYSAHQEKVSIQELWDNGDIALKFYKDGVEYPIDEVEKIVDYDITLIYTTEQNVNFETKIKGCVFDKEGTKEVFAYTDEYEGDLFYHYALDISLSFEKDVFYYNSETNPEIKNVLTYTVDYYASDSPSWEYDVYWDEPKITVEFKFDITEDDLCETLDKTGFGEYVVSIKASEILPEDMLCCDEEYASFLVRVYDNDNSVCYMAGITSNGYEAETIGYNELLKHYMFDNDGEYFQYYHSEEFISSVLADDGWGVRLYYATKVDGSKWDSENRLYYVDVDITTEMANESDSYYYCDEGGMAEYRGKKLSVYSEVEDKYYEFNFYFLSVYYDSGLSEG